MADNTTSSAPMTRAERRLQKRMKRFDNPWMNPKLIWGVCLLLGIVGLGLLGRLLWNLDLVFTGSAPLKLPPVGFENLRRQEGVWDYPLGTDGSGRDLLVQVSIHR